MDHPEPPPPAELRPIDDLRLHVVRNTFCVFRFLFDLGHHLGDLRGALESGETDLAVVTARNAVLTCLSIRSAALTGNVGSLESVKPATHDPFAGVDAASIEIARSLCDEAADAASVQQWQSWFPRLLAFVAGTEAALGLDEPLTEMRTEAGVFGLIRMERRWLKLAQDLGLPGALPKEWGAA
jgi:hypothetical protein